MDSNNSSIFVKIHGVDLRTKDFQFETVLFASSKLLSCQLEKFLCLADQTLSVNLDLNWNRDLACWGFWILVIHLTISSNSLSCQLNELFDSQSPHLPAPLCQNQWRDLAYRLRLLIYSHSHYLINHILWVRNLTSQLHRLGKFLLHLDPNQQRDCYILSRYLISRFVNGRNSPHQQSSLSRHSTNEQTKS